MVWGNKYDYLITQIKLNYKVYIYIYVYIYIIRNNSKDNIPGINVKTNITPNKEKI